MLNAVLFDLDNTLVDRDRAFADCVHAQFDGAAVRAELFRLDENGRGEREALFKFWEQHTGETMNQSIFGAMLAARLQPDEGLIESLVVLSKEVKLGIITNGTGETQRQKLQAAGLTDMIPAEHVWISAEVGTAKPDPAIFRLASGALMESPANCLFIGDREHEDYAGARAAGMRARLVNAPLNRERLEQLLSEEGA